MAEKPILLVSACLLGVRCRYDGKAQSLDVLDALLGRYRVVPICPEQLGGLPTPRVPSERIGERVLSREGTDVTDAFRRGAAEACGIAGRFGARLALMKARSPSCGSGMIYDGSFSGRTVPGDGVAAQALKAMGVRVYSEGDIDALLCGAEEEQS